MVFSGNPNHFFKQAPAPLSPEQVEHANLKSLEVDRSKENGIDTEKHPSEDKLTTQKMKIIFGTRPYCNCQLKKMCCWMRQSNIEHMEIQQNLEESLGKYMSEQEFFDIAHKNALRNDSLVDPEQFSETNADELMDSIEMNLAYSGSDGQKTPMVHDGRGQHQL